MWFTHGGAIEFGQAMLQAGKMGRVFLHLSNVFNYVLFVIEYLWSNQKSRPI